MFCPNCGTEVADGDRFCPGCGHRIDPAAPPEPLPRADKASEPTEAPRPEEPEPEHGEQADGLEMGPADQDGPAGQVEGPVAEGAVSAGTDAVPTNDAVPLTDTAPATEEVPAPVQAAPLQKAPRKKGKVVAIVCAVVALVAAAITVAVLVFRVPVPMPGAKTYPVPVTVSAEGLGGNGSKVALRAKGSTAAGAPVDTVAHVLAEGGSLDLEPGTYTVEASVSPLSADGTLYRAVTPPVPVTVADDGSVQVDEPVAGTDGTADDQQGTGDQSEGQPSDGGQAEGQEGDGTSVTVDYVVAEPGSFTAEELDAVADSAKEGGMDAGTVDSLIQTADDERQKNQDEYLVDGGSFSFVLPESWRDQVEVDIKDGTVLVYPKGVDLPIAKIAVADTTEVERLDKISGLVDRFWDLTDLDNRLTADEDSVARANLELPVYVTDSWVRDDGTVLYVAVSNLLNPISAWDEAAAYYEQGFRTEKPDFNEATAKLTLDLLSGGSVTRDELVAVGNGGDTEGVYKACQGRIVDHVGPLMAGAMVNPGIPWVPGTPVPSSLVDAASKATEAAPKTVTYSWTQSMDGEMKRVSFQSSGDQTGVDKINRAVQAVVDEAESDAKKDADLQGKANVNEQVIYFDGGYAGVCFGITMNYPHSWYGYTEVRYYDLGTGQEVDLVKQLGIPNQVCIQAADTFFSVSRGHSNSLAVDGKTGADAVEAYIVAQDGVYVDYHWNNRTDMVSMIAKGGPQGPWEPLSQEELTASDDRGWPTGPGLSDVQVPTSQEVSLED